MQQPNEALPSIERLLQSNCQEETGIKSCGDPFRKTAAHTAVMVSPRYEEVESNVVYPPSKHDILVREQCDNLGEAVESCTVGNRRHREPLTDKKRVEK